MVGSRRSLRRNPPPQPLYHHPHRDAQPAAGAFPLFQAQDAVVSQAQRADVHAQAVAHAPVAGNMPVAQATVDSSLTRAQVRETTREAIARGFRPASGELS